MKSTTLMMLPAAMLVAATGNVPAQTTESDRYQALWLTCYLKAAIRAYWGQDADPGWELEAACYHQSRVTIREHSIIRTLCQSLIRELNPKRLTRQLTIEVY